MKFRKDKWATVKLSEVCEKTSNVDIRKQSGMFNYIDIGSINSTAKRISKIQELDWSVASSRARQIVKKGDTLFSTVRVNLERIAFVDKEIPNAIASTGFTVIRANEKAEPEYLFYSTSSPFFIEKLCKLQKGTAYPAVSNRIVFNEEIPLPSLEEQKQIAALFKSIETATERAEGQEKNLADLWQKLVNQFVCESPSFGKMLVGKKMIRVKYSEIAEKITRRIDPIAFGIKRRIGGEDFISSDLKLRTWGEVGKDYVGPAFHMHVLPGDILYVSRNSHLRKVAYAEFEGVCSNTTYVIRANEKVVLQDLLKHIMLSEAFTKYAMSVTKGSTNPYLNWKDLDNFYFQIPDLGTQREIVKVLESILEVREQLKQQKTTLRNLKQKLLSEILG